MCHNSATVARFRIKKACGLAEFHAKWLPAQQNNAAELCSIDVKLLPFGLHTLLFRTDLYEEEGRAPEDSWPARKSVTR